MTQPPFSAPGGRGQLGRLRRALRAQRARTARWVLSGALGLLAGGCALLPSAPPATALDAPRVLTAAFELEGRLSASDGDRAASGRLLWIHASGQDSWTAYTPLGQIAAQLTSGPDGAHLITADGQRMHDRDAATLLPRLLGATVPVEGFTHWVQAVPQAGATVLQRDEAGRPARVSDQGWIIDYGTYADASPLAAPRRIDAHRGETRIRLLIDQWTPQP